MTKATGISLFLPLVGLLIITIFCQVWFTVSGFTVRLEDIIILALAATLLLPALKSGELRYYFGPLNFPLFLWAIVILMGIIITILSPLDTVTKKNAIINGIRLILAIGTFFVIDWHSTASEKKLTVILSTITLFSFVTTLVSVLQMGHWDGWLPFALPPVLTTFKEGANTEQGREIFALYLGDTGSHTWSGALAMQAMLVSILAHYSNSYWKKGALWIYFGLLTLILIRISVRNSILGLFITIISIALIRNLTIHRLTARMARPLTIVALVSVLFYGLFLYAPDSYFAERIRQAIPTIENGQLIINRGSNIYGRFEYWSTAIRIFSDAPFVGNGFYSYQALSGSYGTNAVVHAHNSYLQTMAELGVLGVTALALLMGAMTYYLVRAYSICRLDRTATLWWEFTTASIIFLFFSMLFGNTLWSPNYIVFRMILLGVLASLVRRPTQWLY